MMVTIAIPFFNAERYLGEAIESVIWQTYKNWELLLIDDGSMDKSLEIANEYALKDTRIRVLSDGENRNLGFRLNQIPTLVDTKYLLRMDADDIMHPDKIRKQLDYLQKHTDVDVLGTNAYSIDENDNVVGIRFKPSTEKVIDVRSFIHPTIMAKTKWFKDNPYNIEAVRVEDIELWMRSSSKSNFKMLMEPLFFYREFGYNYYKKYQKSLPSLWKMVVKNKFNVAYMQLYFKTIIATCLYTICAKLGMEGKLLQKRNQQKLLHKYYQNYI